jgi:hypothetical protein
MAKRKPGHRTATKGLGKSLRDRAGGLAPRAAWRLGLSALIPFAVMACGPQPKTYWAECVFVPTGERFQGTDFGVSWPRLRDANGFEFDADVRAKRGEAPKWKCRRAV